MNATPVSKFAAMALSLSALLFGGIGCASAPKSETPKYETVTASAGEPRRDSDSAAAHNQEGVARMARGDYLGAEAELKAALSADVMHGPAHNNLGKVYYHQKSFYLAAWEFQYAAKLMPNVPEPRNNLGLVFESAGKLDDAVTSYDEAMKMEPDNAQFLGNLARARVRRGDGGADVRDLLGKLVMRETRPDWADWARSTLATMDSAAHE